MGTKWHPPISLAWTPSLSHPLPVSTSLRLPCGGWAGAARKDRQNMTPTLQPGPSPWTPATSDPLGLRDGWHGFGRRHHGGLEPGAGACGQSWQAALVWRHGGRSEVDYGLRAGSSPRQRGGNSASLPAPSWRRGHEAAATLPKPPTCPGPWPLGAPHPSPRAPSPHTCSSTQPSSLESLQDAGGLR